MAKRSVVILLGVILATVSAVLLGIALFLATRVPGPARATGLVVDELYRPVGPDRRPSGVNLGRYGGYAPVIEFTPPGGAPVRFHSSVFDDPPQLAVGDQVSVRYHPENPQDDFWTLYIGAVIVGGIGLVFGFAASVLGIVAFDNRRRG